MNASVKKVLSKTTLESVSIRTSVSKVRIIGSAVELSKSAGIRVELDHAFQILGKTSKKHSRLLLM